MRFVKVVDFTDAKNRLTLLNIDEVAAIERWEYTDFRTGKKEPRYTVYTTGHHRISVDSENYKIIAEAVRIIDIDF